GTKTRSEYICRYKGKIWMEPDFGYSIGHPCVLFDNSLPGSSLVRSPKTMMYFSGLPSITQYSLARARKTSVRYEPCIIALRHPFDYNYYHVLTELLPTLAMMEEAGVDSTIPVVISPALAEQAFFRALMGRGRLAHRTWLVQESEYIVCDEVIFGRAALGNRHAMELALDMIAAPTPNRESRNRTFLTRDPIHGRSLSNTVDLAPILQHYGFQMVDAGSLTLDQQIQVFSETSVLLGIHGAGLTNMLFRRDAPLTLLELFPPHDAPLDFYVLAHAFDHTYRYLVGSDATSGDRRANFKIDPNQLEAQLAAL
ncbi:MAG: glycosyltransferase family 61 protein, partial [Chloroflexota bacterium]